MEEPTFTHIGKIYGIKCFFNENTMEVKGTNWLNETAISLCIWLDQNFPINYNFEIVLLERLNSGNF